MGNRGASDAGDEPGAGESSGGGVGDGSDERLWLVERTYTDKGLVSLVYATTDGEHVLQRQRSTNALQRGTGVTAAVTADSADLEPVADAETRERYASEAKRMADQHEPDEAV